MNIKFKKANLDDVLYIKEIIDGCGREMFIQEGLRHWVKPISSSSLIKNNVLYKEVYLVILNEQIVGTFTISRYDFYFFDDKSDKYLYLSKLAIRSDKTGLGIGTLCIKFCEDLARKRRLSGIRLEVYEKSVNAINFYNSNGFKDLFLKETKNFKVICMEKLI